jgi:citrate synthase
MHSALKDGLEGVVVARTRLSHVDGEAGRLVIAGRDVEQLEGTFEDVWATLNTGHRPDFGPARVKAFERLPAGLDRPDGMDALRAGVAQLSADSSPVEVGAAIAVYAAAWSRRGQPLRSPDPRLSQAADLLRMVTGEAHAAKVRALDAYLKAVTDHGMNASTFTARVIASTGSDLVSSVTGAIGALKGPLHGGAPGPVLDMLDAIGEPQRAAAWFEAELTAGHRIMGMGHRIYRVRDPRAAVLEREVERLSQAGVSSRRLDLARAVEPIAAAVLERKHPGRALKANVEWYTAVLLDAVGLPRELFSLVFAMGRVAGWCAHVAEQRATGRLIRPASEYVGALP